MKIKFEGIVYEVVDTYSQGYRIEKPEDGYRYVGKHKKECEIVDDSPIEYTKSKQFLHPKIHKYSKTIFINEDHISGEIKCEKDTITVYNNCVVFFSPAKDMMTVIDYKRSERNENNNPIWGLMRYSDDKITLHPSIKSTQHEYCEHYFIKRNEVVNWCNDSWETVYVKKSV